LITKLISERIVPLVLAVSLSVGANVASAAGSASKPSPNATRLIEMAKAKASEDLKDPDSALFRNVALHRGAKATNISYICGEMNAKNGFGGYIGYKPFIATVMPERAEIIGIIKFTDEITLGIYDSMKPTSCVN